MKVNVLGTEYEIKRRSYNEDKDFKKRDIVGYCDVVMKEIVVCNIATYPGYEEESREYHAEIEKQTLRHEIVHAFLAESGLWDNSCTTTGWATNEEMVDWIAIQFPKMIKAFKEAKAI
ncbi:hypothetical protein [Lachnoclostridium phytofermentans]|nr:hypothetical protein [Lachnoclostridium phytofermentans]